MTDSLGRVNDQHKKLFEVTANLWVSCVGLGIVVTFIAMIVYMFTSQINKSVLNCETVGEPKPNTLGLRIFLVQHLTFSVCNYFNCLVWAR